VAWDGALSINGSSFNVDATGNFWINGADLDNAIFSVTNQGEVAMKKGSIALGEITKADGTKATAFYVDDNGNLSIGGTAFTINALGEMTATSGFIGGWEITENALKSVPTGSDPQMILGKNGTIRIGDVSNTATSAFEVTSSGVMKAANYVLYKGTINEVLLMIGKMRISDNPGLRLDSVQN
jgi:hypothetical protein